MKPSLFLSILIFTTGSIFAQNRICMFYDLSGNRTNRSINCGKSTPSVPAKSAAFDSTLKQQPVTETLGEMRISIYPNPTKGQLTVEINNIPADAMGEITLHDLSGKIIISRNDIKETTLLDLSVQPTGVYLLRIKACDKVSEWKVIRQ
jgi:hypothetical protein